MRILILTLSTIALCLQSLAQAPLTIVKGSIEKDSYLKEIGLRSALDESKQTSAEVKKNGKFEIHTNMVEEAGYYVLELGYENGPLLILQPGETVELELSAKQNEILQIKGSPQSKDLHQVINDLNAFDQRKDSLVAAIEKEKEAYRREKALEMKNSLAALLLLAGLEVSEEQELYKEVIGSLSQKYPDNLLVQEMEKEVKKVNLLAEGSEVPEIALPDPDGEIIKLSSLRGKVVLIDFWASWCGPCRREAPNLVKAYEQYSKKDFEIYSVSLDRERDDWLKAIEDDQLFWTHVSDLEFWDCQAVDDYGVEGIPFTVLIDREGKVIAKNLRGDALLETLEDVLDK